MGQLYQTKQKSLTISRTTVSPTKIDVATWVMSNRNPDLKLTSVRRPSWSLSHMSSWWVRSIQWTTQGRYSGLKVTSQGTKPEHIETQLSYLTTEVEWKKVEHIFRSEGRSINSYMQAAYRWLGWGVHGKRTIYAQDYFNRLYMS